MHDSVGNLLAFDDRAYHYGVGNRLTSDGVWTYVYDANGNAVSRSAGQVTQEFDYDSRNRMVRFASDGGVETYAYDDGETRLKKVAGEQTTYYIDADYEEVWDDSGRLEVIKHYRAGQQKVAIRDADGLKYVYPDHLGSSSRMADSSGNQVKAQWYLPFGGDAKETGDAKARYRYTGKEKDDSGLYYYGARYYDDAVGRFLAADSVLPDVYDPQQLNRFAYVRNNPVKLVDPDGHAAAIAVIALGAFLYSYATGKVVVIVGITISAAAITAVVAESASDDNSDSDADSVKNEEKADSSDGDASSTKNDESQDSKSTETTEGKNDEKYHEPTSGGGTFHAPKFEDKKKSVMEAFMDARLEHDSALKEVVESREEEEKDERDDDE